MKSISRIGVLGHSIAYSRSPALHQPVLNTWAASHGFEPPVYEIFDIAPKDLQAFWQECLKLPRVCLNVTIPYKERLLSYISHMDVCALETGAVNTIEITGGHHTAGGQAWEADVRATNTDALAVYELLAGHIQPGRHSKAIVLGSGGAAKAAFWALKRLGIHDLTVAVRAQTSSRTAPETANVIAASELYRHQGADIFINAAPAGLTRADALTLLPALNDGGIVFDMPYRDHVTGLAEMTIERGHTLIDGHAMLACQAQKAFEFWTGDNS